MKTSHRLLAFSAAFAALAAFAADGATNWTDQCAKCHGADGKGDTKMGKKLSIADLSDAKVQAGFTDEAIIKAVKFGLKDKSDKVTMKAIEGLTDDEIKALIPVVRSLKK
jgi:cytochrome c553